MKKVIILLTLILLALAVGMPGVVLLLDDAEFWVAIAYTDSHTTGESCAIAKTSDGKWYKSYDHYCCGLDASIRTV